MTTNETTVRAHFTRMIGRIPMHIPAHAAALGLDLAAPLPGYRWRALCCWCTEKHYDAVVDAVRLHGGHYSSECDECEVIGRDVLLVIAEGDAGITTGEREAMLAMADARATATTEARRAA